MGLITKFKGYTVNGPTDAVELMLRREGSSQPLVLQTSTRQRAGLSPAYEVGTYRPVEQSFEVTPLNIEGEFDEEAFSELVYGMFLPSSDEVTLEADFGGTTYTMTARVVSFGWDRYMQWSGTFQFLDPFWHAATPTVASTSPVTVTGNVPALPKLTISGGNPIARQRVTISDRTGHGVAAYLIAVTPTEAHDEANYRIHANGLELPFAYSGGVLYFRVDVPPQPERTFVDIHMGTAITNTRYAGALDTAGVTLDAGLASGTITADTDAAIANPLAPSLAWHPGVTVAHGDRRPYVFGLNGNSIELIDTDAGGERTSLPNDADSYVMVTGSEALRIRNLSLSVFAGYQKSLSQASGTGSRRMRVRLAKLSGVGASNDEEHYVQWQFGNLIYPSTELITTGSGDQVWHEVAHVGDFATRTAEAIGITPVQGATGTWYLDFPASAFAGQDIELITMSSAARARPSQFEGDVNPSGDSGPIPAHLFQADWVDPATNEPYADDPDTADLLPVALKGQVRASVWYWTHDSEHPIRAWSQVVTGTFPSGRTQTFNNLNIATPGAVQIAIGLEPVAAKPSMVDWGRLTVTSDPVIDLDTDRMPQAVVSSPIPALAITGTIRNTATGARIALTNYLADSNGVEIDTASLTISGPGNVGVTHGQINVNKGAAMFQLMPGENPLQLTGDLEAGDVEVSFNERLAV